MLLENGAYPDITAQNRAVQNPNALKTRLMYNCAHLRSTKESMTVEFGKKECVKSSSSIKCQMFYCHYRVVLVDT